MDLGLAEWIELGRRLKRLDRKLFGEVLTDVKIVVESEEVLSPNDDLVLFGRRHPTKRYSV